MYMEERSGSKGFRRKTYVAVAWKADAWIVALRRHDDAEYKKTRVQDGPRKIRHTVELFRP